MKIIGFNASPRNNENTAWTLNKILESAKEQGAETELFQSGKLDIKPCKGCLGCTETGKCVIKDNMVYDALGQADTLILGSPVYMGQMTAQAKTFTDRLFAQITPRFSPRFKEENAGKKLVLVWTQGNPNPEMFKEYFDYVKRMFQMLEFDVKAVQVVTGTRTEPASERADLLPVLEEIGVSLVLK